MQFHACVEGAGEEHGAGAEGTVVYAHRLVLAMQCAKYFTALFSPEFAAPLPRATVTLAPSLVPVLRVTPGNELVVRVG